ncbi:MAG: hypothetical protein ACUVTP_02875 [Candidatus Fervidibacter sp.]|uniref:hypothetical protein n=1 Tax=Candidatus Fervidibacter sp. TaxID=3100871 RepID=UPI00404A25CF
MLRSIIAEFVRQWAIAQGRRKLEKLAEAETPDIQFNIVGTEVDLWVRDVRKPPSIAPKAKSLTKVTVGGKEFFIYRLTRKNKPDEIRFVEGGWLSDETCGH